VLLKIFKSQVATIYAPVDMTVQIFSLYERFFQTCYCLQQMVSQNICLMAENGATHLMPGKKFV
jgi:hypothetical protein